MWCFELCTSCFAYIDESPLRKTGQVQNTKFKVPSTKFKTLSSKHHHKVPLQMRIVFMGTPAAAVPTLRRCVEDGHEVVAVWTQPDRPSGRGNKIIFSPVKEFALAHGLTVHQPQRIKTDEAKQLFASHVADLAIVVAYGRILPDEYLKAPRRGCINVHFSLLPRYRGAAPANWAIVKGDLETGVTTMFMEPTLDTGPILLQKATPIRKTETAPELMQRLADV